MLITGKEDMELYLLEILLQKYLNSDSDSDNEPVMDGSDDEIWDSDEVDELLRTDNSDCLHKGDIILHVPPAQLFGSISTLHTQLSNSPTLTVQSSPTLPVLSSTLPHQLYLQHFLFYPHQLFQFTLQHFLFNFSSLLFNTSCSILINFSSLLFNSSYFNLSPANNTTTPPPHYHHILVHLSIMFQVLSLPDPVHLLHPHGPKITLLYKYTHSLHM